MITFYKLIVFVEWNDINLYANVGKTRTKNKRYLIMLFFTYSALTSNEWTGSTNCIKKISKKFDIKLLYQSDYNYRYRYR